MTAGAAARAGVGGLARAGVGPMMGAVVGFAARFGWVGVEVGGSGVAATPALAAEVARRAGVAGAPAALFAAGTGLVARAAATAGAAGVGLGELDTTPIAIGEPRITASIVRSGVGCGMFVGVASTTGFPARPQATEPSRVAHSMTRPSERRAVDRRAPSNRIVPPSSRRPADGVHDARNLGPRRGFSIGIGAEKLQPNRARSTPPGALFAPDVEM